MDELAKYNYIELIPEIEGVDEEDYIYISKKAIEKIKEIRELKNVPEEYYLRIQTQSSSNTGIGFHLVFDSNITDYDKILKSNDIEILIDSKTLFYLMGYVIDYKQVNETEGFVFTLQDTKN